MRAVDVWITFAAQSKTDVGSKNLITFSTLGKYAGR